MPALLRGRAQRRLQTELRRPADKAGGGEVLSARLRKDFYVGTRRNPLKCQLRGYAGKYAPLILDLQFICRCHHQRAAVFLPWDWTKRGATTLQRSAQACAPARTRRLDFE